MTTVADILRSQASPTIHTVDPAASVFDAVRLMAQQNIGALVVVEHDRRTRRIQPLGPGKAAAT